MQPMPDKAPPVGGLIGAGALLVALGGTLLWLTILIGPWRLASGLLDASRQLEQAQNSLSAGQAKAAHFHVLAGSAAARRARAGWDSNSPLLDLAALVPTIDKGLRETDHLVAAAEYSAHAASGSFEIASNALTGPNPIIAPNPEDSDGSSLIRLDRVEAMADTVTEVRNSVQLARTELRQVNLGNLPRRARPNISDSIRQMTKTDDVLSDAEVGLNLLPAILGAEEPRTYLFGMQNSAELRGTGGALLQYAVLTFEGGQARFESAASVYRVDRDRRQVQIPLPEDAWYVSHIPDAQRFGNANWSPDWPLSANLTIDYARASRHDFPDVDGFIALDPVVLEKLVPGVERYRTRWGNRISADSAVGFLLYKAYGSYPRAYLRRIALKQVVDEFFKRILKPAHPTLLVGGLGASLAQKHMQIWLADADEQSFIDRMDWAGKIDRAANSDYLNVVQQNVGGNKLDYHAEQTTTMDVTLAGTDALVDTEIAIQNNIFGPQTQWLMGNSGPLHRPMINLYVPEQAQFESASVSPETCAACPSLGAPTTTQIDSPPGTATWTDGRPMEHTELGKKVWTATLQIPPGEQGSVRYRYTVPGVVRSEGGRTVYRLVVQHQPKVHAETMRIRITLPDGATAIKAPVFNRSEDELRWERKLTRDMVFEISFSS
jgi:hypothetical protein